MKIIQIAYIIMHNTYQYVNRDTKNYQTFPLYQFYSKHNVHYYFMILTSRTLELSYHSYPKVLINPDTSPSAYNDIVSSMCRNELLFEPTSSSISNNHDTRKCSLPEKIGIYVSLYWDQFTRHPPIIRCLLSVHHLFAP